MIEITTISASSLAQLTRCAWQWYLYKTLGPRPPGIAAYRGRGADAGVNLNMQTKIETHEPAPRDAVSDAARDAVAHDIEREGVLLTDDEQSRGLKIIKGETQDAAARLSLLHYDVLAPKIVPVTVQRKFEIEFPSRHIVLNGRLDLETECGIRDLKTRTHTPAANFADTSDQLTFYALDWRVRHGAMPQELGFDILVDLKEPRALRMETTRTEVDCQRLVNRIDAALAVIRSGVFMPAPRDSWFCSKRFCGFWSVCPYCGG